MMSTILRFKACCSVHCVRTFPAGGGPVPMLSSSSRFPARCSFSRTARFRCFSTVLTCTSARSVSVALSRWLYSSALCSMVCCSCERSPSRWEIFCSMSEFAVLHSLRLFLSDCTWRLRFEAVDDCLSFLTFGSYFNAIASRLWMVRSISRIICSCRRFSCSRRSSIRWISFFMACASAWPMFGSSASCISFSRVILRSHSSTWRSASRMSCVIWVLSSLTRSMECSTSMHEPSISLSLCTNSVSNI
mmetsp:Transcript_119335/g.338383  ORF Transcript_119335/g.338383 Transcript_119335/m.338383 type:complete len:247 (-) Transcript_119335:1937-2677(-)